MTLKPGTRLGPYKIVALVGSGGMGEVYRATDTRLDRTVALKVLHAQVAGHPERRQRFEREARAVARLNHPHICDLHDIGHDRGSDFLVLEYLEGQTLADRLIKGPLPLDQVIRYAIEIADALTDAHRHGLVHRDLKPGNIMLTGSGVKLLDFGLAKLRAIDSLPALSTVATGRPPLTAEGALLGTILYMAPEQLEGREVDPRADIFSFGTVVYEMATGRKAFEGNTQASAIGAILHTDPPPMASFQPLIPPALDRVVLRCLAKDPDSRWQTMRDLMLELKWITEEGSQPYMPAPAPRIARHKPRPQLAWTGAVLLAISTLLLAIVHFREAPAERRVFRLPVVPGQPILGDVSVSPDGRRVAFVVGSAPENYRLWIQSFDSFAPQPLAGTEGAEIPFWSPDGHFLAFNASGKIKKVAASGGPVQMLCDAPAMVGATWNRDGVIVFPRGNRTGLYRVSAAGGEATPLTTLDRSRGENTHRWPQFLPDGRRFLFLARSTQPENSGIYVGSLDSPRVTRVLDIESRAAYASPGFLLFVRGGALLAQRFDASRLRMVGDPFQVAEDVRYNVTSAYGGFSISNEGVLAYETSPEPSHVAWFTRTGKRLESPNALSGTEEPSLAPGGKRAALTRWVKGASDIWTVDRESGSGSRLTHDQSSEMAPIWSPDGNAIVFHSNRDGPSDLYRIASNGTGPVETLFTSRWVKHASDWSPDGRFIVFATNEPATRWDLWILPGAGGKPTPFLRTEFAERMGRFAPNGRWIAYVSNESGIDEVYVQPFPAAAVAGKWKVSVAGGTEPRWRRDGRELFYLAADGKLTAVSVKTDTTFDHGVPAALFEARPSPDGIWSYDVTPNGQQFLVSTSFQKSTSVPITVILNWTAGLPR